MVIMEMVKEFTSGEALTIQSHRKLNSSPLMHWIDPNFIGLAFNNSEELLKDVMRFIQDFAYRFLHQ